MQSRDQRREATVDAVADHLLAHGLDAARLRPLAAALGTSDRMLLYYFADKEELLTAALTRIAMRLTGLLDAALPAGRGLAFAPLFRAVWGVVGAPDLQPYMRVWLELAAGAARGQHPHRVIGHAIMDGFVAWVSERLEAPDAATRDSQAALLLATVEGCLFLDAAGRRDIADVAAATVGKA